MTTDTIPEAVLTILEAVRSEGEMNMFARDAVMRLAFEYAEQDEGELGAVAWLHENPNRYVEALKAMGARRRHA